MKLIGLTGSIATGKSTVARMFKERGFYVIDADELAHSVYKKGEEAYFKLIEVFGRGILDKSREIDRKKLGALVIKDKEKLKILESIVHPEVERKRKEIIENIKREIPDAMIIYDVPLLFEKNLEKLFDCVIVVYAKPELQIKRLMERDGMTEDEAKRRIAMQLSIEKKRELADVVIDNSNSIDHTKKQVEEIAKRIKDGQLC